MMMIMRGLMTMTTTAQTDPAHLFCRLSSVSSLGRGSLGRFFVGLLGSSGSVRDGRMMTSGLQETQLTSFAACHRCHLRAKGPQAFFSWGCWDHLGGCQRACCLSLGIPPGYQHAPEVVHLGSVGLWGHTAPSGTAAADAPAQAESEWGLGPCASRSEPPHGL